MLYNLLLFSFSYFCQHKNTIFFSQMQIFYQKEHLEIYFVDSNFFSIFVMRSSYRVRTNLRVTALNIQWLSIAAHLGIRWAFLFYIILAFQIYVVQINHILLLITRHLYFQSLPQLVQYNHHISQELNVIIHLNNSMLYVRYFGYLDHQQMQINHYLIRNRKKFSVSSKKRS